MASYDQREETPSLTTARQWLDKIKVREKEFSTGWWKAAAEAVSLYNSEKETDCEPYNILYSNTEVLVPSLYSATPRPDVRPRYHEQSSKGAPDLAERFLKLLADPNAPGVESLDDAMEQVVLSALVPGMGFARLRHYPEHPMPLCPEAGHWKGLIWPRAKKWSKLPWVAFRHELTKEEMFQQFGKDLNSADDLANYQPQEQAESEPNAQKPDGSIVYELWIKATKRIIFLCEDWKELVLREDSDTYNLPGFFPTPGLLMLTDKPGKLIPTPLYKYYQNQAEELNRVTVRLNKVLSALKVRGAYNSLLGPDLEKILSDEAMDNALVPAQEAGLLAQNGGFERQIWLLPIDKLIVVAQQLYLARVQIKQVIYELTGISDIIRGSSVASETATAQDLKNKWGTIRLRKMQRQVSMYIRDLFRLAITLGSRLIPAEQWKSITQVPYPTQQEKVVAMQQAAFDQAMGRPPNPQMQATLQQPTIEELVQSLSQDNSRLYLIDVETNSTIDIDTAADKQEVAEFMAAMGQLLGGLQPLASLGPSGLEASKQILLAVCSRFKFGLDIIDAIKGIQPPPPGAPDPKQQQAMEEAKIEIQVKQAEASAKLQKMQMDQQLAQEKMQLEREKLAFERERMNIEITQARLQSELMMGKLAIQKQQQTELAKGKPKETSNAAV